LEKNDKGILDNTNIIILIINIINIDLLKINDSFMYSKNNEILHGRLLLNSFILAEINEPDIMYEKINSILNGLPIL